MKKLMISMGFVLFPILHTYACSCIKIKMPLHKKVKSAFANSDVIFTGKVIDIKEINTILPYKSSSDPVMYTFEIIDNFKGELKTHSIQILTAQSGASCGYSFTLGESYVVFSSVSDHFSPKTGIKSSFVTSLCRRNKKLKTVHKREYKILKRLSKIY